MFYHSFDGSLTHYKSSGNARHRNLIYMVICIPQTFYTNVQVTYRHTEQLFDPDERRQTYYKVKKGRNIYKSKLSHVVIAPNRRWTIRTISMKISVEIRGKGVDREGGVRVSGGQHP